jgi:hypothetical protein
MTYSSAYGGEGVDGVKPETTQRCPQVSGECAGRRVVVAHCFQRRVVSCKGTGDPLTRPAPAGENAGAGHPLPQGGEGRKPHKAKESQRKCRNCRFPLSRE